MDEVKVGYGECEESEDEVKHIEEKFDEQAVLTEKSDEQAVLTEKFDEHAELTEKSDEQAVLTEREGVDRTQEEIAKLRKGKQLADVARIVTNQLVSMHAEKISEVQQRDEEEMWRVRCAGCFQRAMFGSGEGVACNFRVRVPTRPRRVCSEHLKEEEEEEVEPLSQRAEDDTVS